MGSLASRGSAFLFVVSITGCGNSAATTASSTGQTEQDGGLTGGGGAGGGGATSTTGAGGAAGGGGMATTGIAWGTFERPFAADSLWNSSPIDPVLGTYQIPPTEAPTWVPMITGGQFSTTAFLASESDPPMTVLGSGNAMHPNCQDTGGPCPVVIPHWPASTIGASGGDGHADIVDEKAGIIHSFYQLKKDASDVWHAAMYGWSPLAGSGWGDPAHYSQGARASGVCTVAGVIRVSEANDGETMFHHALAMSLDSSAMMPGFTFPATLEDGYGPTEYKGKIPMGSVLMLPPSYDTSKIASPGLLKVIKTLQVYGARIVDTNTDTPFVIYIENGSSFTVSTKPPGEWDTVVANQLFDIAHALRVLSSSSGFMDGNGKAFNPNPNLNRMSMRGPWNAVTDGGDFDSWLQALVFPATTTKVTQTQTNGTCCKRMSWAPWTAGASFRFSVFATGGAKLNLQFKDSNYQTLLETGSLGDGENKSFAMPTNNGWPVLVATSGIGAGSTVRGTLVAE